MKDYKTKTDSITIKKSKKSQSDIIESLRKLSINTRKDVYGKKAVTIAIPKIVKKAIVKKLNKCLEMNLRRNEEQIARLEKIFTIIDKKVVPKKSYPLEETKFIMDENTNCTI